MEKSIMKNAVKAVLLSSVVLSAGISQAADLKVGGFVDGQYQWDNKGLTNTFKIQDGALQLAQHVDNAGFVLDLPFHTNAGSMGLFVGTDQAQAFVDVRYDNGGRWKLGQFDSIYGFESNRTVDLFFTRQGQLHNALPKTFDGLLLGYDASKELGINLMVANPADAPFMAKQNPALGAQVTYKSDMGRAAVGYEMNKDSAANATSSLIDVVVGGNFGALAVDLEGDVQKTLSYDSGKGLLANVIYSVDDKLGLGVRGEYFKNWNVADASGAQVTFPAIGTAAPSAVNKGMDVTVGPSYAMSKNLRVRADYTFTSITAVENTDAVKAHAAAVSAVYKF
jgi:hypothetical protein